MVAEWFYAEQGQQRGPVTFVQLQQLAASGTLKPSDLVWKQGLSDWIPASSQPGLFAAAAPAPTPELTFVEPPAKRDRAREDDRDDDVEEDRPRRRSSYERPTKSSGSSAGLKIALFGGGAAVLLLLVCCGIIGVIAVANAGPSNEKKWSLKSGEHKSWTVRFNQGDPVVIRVNSTGQSDMDLFVFDSDAKMKTMLNSRNIEGSLGLCVVYDNGPSQNCECRFTARQTQDYYILVVNRQLMPRAARDGPNSGTMIFTPAPK